LELKPPSFSGLEWYFLAFFASGFDSDLPPIQRVKLAPFAFSHSNAADMAPQTTAVVARQ
jgi:hypothetical protein